MAASVLQLRPNLSVHPIAPNPIVVLHSEHPLETVEVRPRTTQWDPAPTLESSPESNLLPEAPRSAALSSRLSRITTAAPSLREAHTAHPLPPEGHGACPWVETAETMRLPAGATEDLLSPGEPPEGPLAARVAMTRLSRELGRAYRHRYGVSLTVDVVGIERMQYHLLRRLSEARLDEKSGALFEAELTRHGALLSEIFARRLGAEWLELGDAHPTDWMMGVGRGVRVWPVWRVHNFLRQPWDGHGALLDLYERLRAGVSRR
jgi:hypothetical protein